MPDAVRVAAVWRAAAASPRGVPAHDRLLYTKNAARVEKRARGEGCLTGMSVDRISCAGVAG